MLLKAFLRRLASWPNQGVNQKGFECQKDGFTTSKGQNSKLKGK
jgi:hypothetical protein